MTGGRVFSRRLASRRILITGYCVLHCFLEIFVGNKAVMKRHKVVVGGSPHFPPPPPTVKTLGDSGTNCTFYVFLTACNVIQKLKWVKLSTGG